MNRSYTVTPRFFLFNISTLINQLILLTLLMCTNALATDDHQKTSIPGSKALQAMFRAEQHIACYAFIDEGSNYKKCVKNSTLALSSSNVTYEQFTVSQLKLLATRSPFNSPRQLHAIFILNSIGIAI